MKRAPTPDAARAALHALGALPADEAAAFEVKLRDAPALRAEVDSLRGAADELALAAEPAAPRPELRARVLGRIARLAAAADAPPVTPALLFAFADEGGWITVAPGLERRDLHRQGGSGAFLLRVAPGTSVPRHEHRAVEHAYVLSGSLEVEGQLCLAGDYHRAAPETVHRDAFSRDGCVVLIVAESTA